MTSWTTETFQKGNNSKRKELLLTELILSLIGDDPHLERRQLEMQLLLLKVCPFTLNSRIVSFSYSVPVSR